MVTQVPLFSEPLPNPLEMTPEEFESSATTLVSELNPRFQAANVQALELNEMAANVEVAAGAAANAKWVSGTYVQGEIAWSPTDYLDYRCRNAGLRTIDPVLDPTNWQLRTKTNAGGSDTTSSAVDITLTSASGRLQIISMTAASKKTTLPSATTLGKGTPLFVIKNAGQYRFSVHKNGGVFLCYVQPGQTVAFNCSDISTAAGVWYVGGHGIESIYDGNTPEVLNAVDSRTIAVAMLSTTKAICVFRNNSTGYLWSVILNYGSSSGTPAAINAEASEYISIAAQTSTQATVVYKTSTGVTKGYVLDISSNTITPGVVATIDTGTGSAGTDLTALSATQLLCAYGDSGPKERILDISASVITPSVEITADATAASQGNIRVRKISATKALYSFRGSSPKKIYLRLQTVSGSTPAPSGSVFGIDIPSTSSDLPYGLVVMGASRALLIQPLDRAYGDLMISLLDVSGSTPVLIGNKIFNVGLLTSAMISSDRIGTNTAYITWTGGESLGVDSLIVTMTDDDNLNIGQISSRLEPRVTAAEGYVACAALDSTHVMQVCRNATTFLSAKTIEIAA